MDDIHDRRPRADETEADAPAASDPPGPPVASDPPGSHIVAVAVVVRRGSEILAMRRSARKDAGPGLWETISGRLERGEDPLAAAMREVGEETGLSVAIDPRPVTAYRATRLGHPMVVIVYAADWLDGEVQMSEEHDACAWLTADRFAQLSTLEELVSAVRRLVGS